MELAQKGNRYLYSKQVAFGQMRDELAGKMVEQWPDMKDAVERVLDGKGAGVDGIEGFVGGGNGSRMKAEEGKGDEVGDGVEKRDETTS